MITYTEDILLGLRGSITVVGNAPMSGYGKRIDSFDNVIRFNDYVLEGYEEAVGKKETLWCTCCNENVWTRKDILAISPFNIEENENRHAEHWPFMHFLSWDAHESITLVDTPTTGATLVSLCSYLGMTVTVFGFNGLKAQHYFPSDKKHWDMCMRYHTEADKEFAKLFTLPGVTMELIR